jgi:hypothetical protein
VLKVGIDSMPRGCGQVLRAAVKKGGPLTTPEVMSAIGVKSSTTAAAYMRELDEAVEFFELQPGGGPPNPDQLALNTAGSWAWLGDPNLPRLLSC